MWRQSQTDANRWYLNVDDQDIAVVYQHTGWYHTRSAQLPPGSDDLAFWGLDEAMAYVMASHDEVLGAGMDTCGLTLSR